MKRIITSILYIAILSTIAMGLFMYAPSPVTYKSIGIHHKYITPYSYIRKTWAFTGCNNLTLPQSWKCIDSAARSGTGTNPTTLTDNNNAGIQIGDVPVAWCNLVTTSWTSQTIAVTDNASNTYTQWAKGMNTFSNPANQWAGAFYYTIATANKASAYAGTCTVTAHGGASATADDFGFAILRPPTPALSIAEDVSDWQHPVNGGGGTCPCITISPSGQTLTTNFADLVLVGGNSDAGSAQIDSPFTGLDGDGSGNFPFYYLNGDIQSGAGSITGKWYITNASDTTIGSFMIGLHVSLTATSSTNVVVTGKGTVAGKAVIK